MAYACGVGIFAICIQCMCTSTIYLISRVSDHHFHLCHVYMVTHLSHCQHHCSHSSNLSPLLQSVIDSTVPWQPSNWLPRYTVNYHTLNSTVVTCDSCAAHRVCVCCGFKALLVERIKSFHYQNYPVNVTRC